MGGIVDTGQQERIVTRDVPWVVASTGDLGEALDALLSEAPGTPKGEIPWLLLALATLTVTAASSG